MMNRSRSNTPPQADRPTASQTAIPGEGQDERINPARPARSNQLSEILDRQKILARAKPQQAATPASMSLADQIRERLKAPAAAQASHEHVAETRFEPRRTAAPAPAAQVHASAPAGGDFDIAGAFARLRHDLKQDLAASFSHELSSLRAEIREIGASVSQNGSSSDLYADLERLATGIEYLGEQAAHNALGGITGEVEALRHMIEGLASREDLHALASQMPLEPAFDAEALFNEIAQLSDHVETIRGQLVSTNVQPAVDALDQKISAIVDAIEMFFNQTADSDQDLGRQIVALDARLEDITAAIEATAQATAGLSNDAGIAALDARITRLVEEINGLDLPQWEENLATRIDSLSGRIEELARLQATDHLDQRFDELVGLLQNTQAPANHDEILNIVADISQRIEDMATGSVNSDLIARFDELTHRIDTFAPAAQQQSGFSDEILSWLEERMNDIAARIDDVSQPHVGGAADLSGLEQQIAQLSALLSQPRIASDVGAAVYDERMSALENYMATNDEYIVEAARQAAETALESYVRNYGGHVANGGQIAPADLGVITGLAADLRALEDLTRSGEARNQQTFEALQDTLLQIADRLDKMADMAPVAQAGAAAAAAQAADAPAQTKLKSVQSAMPVKRYADGTEMFAGHDELEDDLLDAPIANEATPASASEGSRGGLLSSLARKLRPGKKDSAAEENRTQVDSAPAIDAADDISPDIANQLLEPGSGAPDIRKILEKVRAAHDVRPKKSDTPARFEDDNSDFIAAARRAAQAAAEEINPGERNVGAEDGASKYRRPLLLAAGAVLLAVLAYPLAGDLFGGNSTPAATAPAPVAAPASGAADAKTDDKPAADTAAAAKDETKLPPSEDRLTPEEAAKASMPASSDAQTVPPATPVTTMPIPAPAMTSPTPVSEAAPAKDTPAAGISTPAEATAAAKPAGENKATAAAPAPADSKPADQPQANTAPSAPATATAAAAPAAAPAVAATPSLTVPAGIAPQALVDAANGNDPLALFEVGNRLTDGNGVPADQKGAIAWYEKASNLGFVPATYRLGNIYEKGIGVQPDIAKAMDYYQTAAKAGNVGAMHNLAVLFATGNNGAPDFASAAKWFTEAANHGVRDSEFNLAILYAKGSGVPQDLQQSYKWFGIAAKDGDQDAGQKRDEVAKVLTADQLTKAKADVDGWKVAPVDDKANSAVIPDAWAGKPQKTSSVDMKKAILYIQALLGKAGYDVGRPDGVMGAKTVAAIKQFQTASGLESTGEINDALVKALLAKNKS